MRSRISRHGAYLLAIVVLAAAPVTVGCGGTDDDPCPPLAELESPTASIPGRLVAASDDTVAVRSTDGASVDVYVRDGASWRMQQALTPMDGAVPYERIEGVAVAGDVAVIAASRRGKPDVDGLGYERIRSAHVFSRAGETWTPSAELIRYERWWDSYPPMSVALDGDTVVVGDPMIDTADVFVNTAGAWAHQQTLDKQDFDNTFGSSVALSGSTLWVGDPYGSGDQGGFEVGLAYAFTREGAVWSEVAKFTGQPPTDGATGPNLGLSVSVSGDYAVAASESWAPERAGRVRVYARDMGQWTEVQILDGDDIGDRFGISVSIEGTAVAIGATRPWVDGERAGRTYLYEQGDGAWCRTRQFFAGTSDMHSRFGYRVVLTTQTLFVTTEEPETTFVFSR